MSPTLKYLLGSVWSLPLLPLCYWQGKQIRRSVPRLPEAGEPSGTAPSKGETGKLFRLLTLGESTIAGVGVATHREGFTGALAETLATKLNRPVAWRVYAKSGYTARQVREKILPTITEQEAELIVIGLGGNDAFTLNRPNRWRDHVAVLIDDLQTRFPDTPILFCNMPPIKEFPAFTRAIKWTIGNLVELLGDELDSLTQAMPRVHYATERISLATWDLSSDIDPADYFSDGIHPSGLTYRTWGHEMGTLAVQQFDLTD